MSYIMSFLKFSFYSLPQCSFFFQNKLIELWTWYILLDCLPSLTSPSVYICTLPCVPKCMLNYFDIKTTLLLYSLYFLQFNQTFIQTLNRCMLSSKSLLLNRETDTCEKIHYSHVYKFFVVYDFLNSIKNEVWEKQASWHHSSIKETAHWFLYYLKIKHFFLSTWLSHVDRYIFKRELWFQLVWAQIFPFSKIISYSSLDLKWNFHPNSM